MYCFGRRKRGYARDYFYKACSQVIFKCRNIIIESVLKWQIDEPHFICVRIDKYLFEGIYDHAGKFREYNISKSEMILNEESVKYANYFAIQSTLEYDMETMKKVRYTQMSADEMVDKIVTFTSSIWQVHPFMEGNTRTTALFIEQYLNGMGFDVNIQVFQEKAKYFRNALVRSNYSDYVRGIESTDDYLKKFFENLLLGKKHELRSRDLVVAACFE